VLLDVITFINGSGRLDEELREDFINDFEEDRDGGVNGGGILLTELFIVLLLELLPL